MKNVNLVQCFVLTVACLSATANAQSIVMRGSDTLGEKMVPLLAKAYQDAGNAAEFDIVAEGSSDAFKALLAGQAEIGMSSRPIKDSEKEALEAAGMRVNEHVAGVDMIAVIVNESNAASNATVSSIGKIFTSAVSTWKTADGAEIQPFTRNETSGTYKVFQELAMEGADYGKTTIKLEGNGEIAEQVAASPGGVGYVGLSYANASGVKALAIDGVLPEAKNASTYPLSRKLYYYTIEGKTSQAAVKFLTWATTDPVAAKIVNQVGFIAVQ